MINIGKFKHGNGEHILWIQNMEGTKYESTSFVVHKTQIHIKLIMDRNMKVYCRSKILLYTGNFVISFKKSP